MTTDWADILDLSAPHAARLWLGSSIAEVARQAGVLGYLATPYLRETIAAGVWRMERSAALSASAALVMVDLAQAGVSVVAPAVQMAEMCNVASILPRGRRLNPLDPAFWERWCRPLLAAADFVVVPDMPGWERSEAVLAAARHAVDTGLPLYLFPERCDVGG